MNCNTKPTASNPCLNDKVKRNKLTTCVKPARLWLPFGFVLAMASGGAFATSVITPVSAVANQEHTAANLWGLASNLIDASAINGSNQLIARGWNNNYLSNAWGTWEQWVVVDLGADYDLAEINVWNYHDSDTANNLVGRSTSGSSLWVGGSGATLPTAMTPVGLDVAGSTSTDINGNNPFNAGTGWTSVWSGDLPNHTMDGLARDADLTVDASAQTGVRYVGFNIDDRYGHYNYDLSGLGLGNQVEDPAYPSPWSSFEAGLGYIQVTGMPALSTTGLHAPSLVTGSTDGNAAQLTFAVGNTAGVGYNVTGLSYTPAATDFSDGTITPLLIEGGRSENVTVDLTPSIGGLAEATLTLTTDDPANPTIDVDLSVEVHDPEASIESMVDFGIFATTPEPTTITVQIDNLGGTANLNISAPVIGGPGADAFSVASLPGPIAAGGSDAVSVTFDPLGAGNFSAQLSLTTDAPFTPTVTVDLTGLVIASGGELLQPVAAEVSSSFEAGHDAATLTDLAHLDASNLHIGGDFAANISWLSADNATSDEWVYLDLGAEFTIGEVRIWNYHEVVGADFETSGRSVKGYELFVAGTGASLPVGPSESPFDAGGGWASASGPGDLAIGPPTANAGVPVLAATDALAVPMMGVRYIGIDIGSRHAPDPFTATAVGLAQIQVVLGVPPFEITSIDHDPASGGVVITFDSSPGELYFMDASGSLRGSGEPGGWLELGDFESLGSSTTICIIPPGGTSSCPPEFTFTAPLASRRFFRVRRGD